MEVPKTYKEAMQMRKNLQEEAEKLQRKLDEMQRQDMKLNDLACLLREKERKEKAQQIKNQFGRHGKIHTETIPPLDLKYGDLISIEDGVMFVDQNLQLHICPKDDGNTYLPEVAEKFLSQYDLTSSNDMLAFYGFTYYEEKAYFFGIYKNGKFVDFS